MQYVGSPSCVRFARATTDDCHRFFWPSIQAQWQSRGPCQQKGQRNSHSAKPISILHNYKLSVFVFPACIIFHWAKFAYTLNALSVALFLPSAQSPSIGFINLLPLSGILWPSSSIPTLFPPQFLGLFATHAHTHTHLPNCAGQKRLFSIGLRMQTDSHESPGSHGMDWSSLVAFTAHSHFNHFGHPAPRSGQKWGTYIVGALSSSSQQTTTNFGFFTMGGDLSPVECFANSFPLNDFLKLKFFAAAAARPSIRVPPKVGQNGSEPFVQHDNQFSKMLCFFAADAAAAAPHIACSRLHRKIRARRFHISTRCKQKCSIHVRMMCAMYVLFHVNGSKRRLNNFRQNGNKHLHKASQPHETIHSQRL